MIILRADWHFVSRHPAHFLAFGFGAGLAAKAPGTWGTLVALPLYYGLMLVLNQTQMLVLIALAFVAGIYICDVAGRNLGVSDHGGIVWDEIVAMWLVLVFTPLSVLWWSVAFGLFRLFDIWKPFPISWFDTHIKNGLGVMLDDLLAAGFAIASLYMMLWVLT
ncbi:MAG: phosphatidylglycerophosphatase A [Sulfuriferula sp.]|nr:phosphatidylglycerophosphatase A [Sulfuriferula sp.]